MPCSESDTVRHADGSEHDLGGQWRQVTLYTAVSEAVDRDVSVDTPVEDLRKLAAEFDVEIDESWSAGQIVLELFEKLVEHTLHCARRSSATTRWRPAR